MYIRVIDEALLAETSKSDTEKAVKLCCLCSRGLLVLNSIANVMHYKMSLHHENMPI